MSPRTFVTRGAALLAIASFGLAACESKTVVTPQVFPITVTVTPAAVTLTAVNQTAQFVALVSGGPDGTAGTVTWTSSNTAVATVDANGVVTAKANGSTSIIAKATADATKQAAGVVTVNISSTVVTPPAAPTISIQSITTNGGANVDLANTFGQINVALNVDVPTGNTINSVNVQVDGTTVCSQTFTQGTQAGVGVEAANAVVIVCSINTAALKTDGTPVFANGPHTITATLVGPGGTVKASTSTSLVFANVSMLGLTFSASKTATAANGQVWNGGVLTVVVTPALFGTSPLTSITVTLTPAVGAAVSKTQAVSGTGPQTFVFVDTAGSALKVAALEALTAVTATSSTVSGNQGPSFPLVTPPQAAINVLVDEKPPVVTGTGLSGNGFNLNSGTAAPFWFNASSVLTATALGFAPAAAVDGGVNTNTVTVESSPNVTTKVWTPVTTVAALGQQAANSTLLRVTFCDALGNCATPVVSSGFGIDLVPPQLVVTAPAAINPAVNYTFAVADTGVIGTVVSGTPSNNMLVIEKIFTPAATKCVSDLTAFTLIAVPTAGCAEVASSSAGFLIPPNTTFEGYDSVYVTAVDSAGNRSATVAKLFLRDVTAPQVGPVSPTALNLVGGSAVSFTAIVQDNVDLNAMTATEAFGAVVLDAGSATIGTFGLPFTLGPITQTVTLNPFITSLEPAASLGGVNPSVDASAINMTVTDQANNSTAAAPLALAAPLITTQVAFDFASVAAGGLKVQTAVLTANNATICAVTSPCVSPTTSTFTYTVTLPTGTSSPFGVVNLYRQDAGGVLRLVGTTSTGFISETATLRTITYTITYTAAGPAAGYNFFAIGLDTKGHGLVSNAVPILIN